MRTDNLVPIFYDYTDIKQQSRNRIQNAFASSSSSYSKRGRREKLGDIDTLVGVSKIIFIVTFQRGHRKKKASYPITITPIRRRHPELQYSFKAAHTRAQTAASQPD